MMKTETDIKDKLRRGGIFIFTAVLHIFLLFFIVFTIEVTAGSIEIPASVMKLADIQEKAPPPPPPVKEIKPVEQQVSETVAETVIEVEEAPVDIAAPVSAPIRYTEEYLPQNQVSVVPLLSEKEIRERLVYPPIALRSGLEGIVYLELYIDRDGHVRRIKILKENPPGRGFGEAAVRAFEGLSGKPAQANGEAVAVRYRYPVRFQIK